LWKVHLNLKITDKPLFGNGTMKDLLKKSNNATTKYNKQYLPTACIYDKNVNETIDLRIL